MNFSIHLPQPLLADLDNFAQARKTSRSGIVRDAVENYLAQQRSSAWPEDLRQWMEQGIKASFKAGKMEAPDFAAIRCEMNQAPDAREQQLLRSLKP
jgi:predicted transcriptional regulator